MTNENNFLDVSKVQRNDRRSFPFFTPQINHLMSEFFSASHIIML